MDVRQYLVGAARNLHVEVLSEVDSTNTYLRSRASEGIFPRAALALSQTGGRGRRGRSFSSPPDTGLYLSLLLKPLLPPERFALLTTAAAVAVCEAVEELSGEKAGIKWVNDIIMRKKKVCGILTEGNVFEGYAVIGVGINVFEPSDGFPPEIADIAGSVLQTRTIPQARERLAGAVLSRLIAGADNAGAHVNEYRRRCVVLGKDVRVLAPSGEYDARAVDINDSCELIVKLPDGEMRTLGSGEISIRPSI